MPTGQRQTERGGRAAVSRRDRGATFIEMLVSIVLLGTAGIATLTATAAALRGARVHADVAAAQNWLATAGDALAHVPAESDDNYVACDGTAAGDAAILAAYQDVIDAVPTELVVTVDGVTYWSSATESFGTDCRHALGDRLQLVRLGVVVDDVAETVTVVKRPATEPTVSTLPPPTTIPVGAYEPEPTPGL